MPDGLVDFSGHVLEVMPNLLEVLTDFGNGSINISSNSLLVAPSRPEVKDKFVGSNIRPKA
ncbi:hypothetical protein AU467_22620 [Mesorhizobium loti]|uniref:Uncharacterized protein n=1 Tax=Rhizobium loti TaxID=381 RepID=A0A124GGC5_RHILI|nr:hypothetical protein AU467_22620 [Mesorhizobium loti]